MREQRDDARHDTEFGLYQCSDLHSKLRRTEDELRFANERLQALDNDMDDERREFRKTEQELNDQHLDDQEEIRSLKQHVSNTECDRDDYARRLGYASRISRNVALEHQKLLQEKEKLERENQQLKAKVADRDETISGLQAQTNEKKSEIAATVSSPTINIQSNEVVSAHGSSGVQDLEQQNRTLTSEITILNTSLENLRNEHGKCSGHLQTKLAEKDEEMRILQAEKKAVDEESAKTVNKLREKEQGLEDLEKTKRELVASQASSAETVKRLDTLSQELEVSRRAHAQCDEKSAGQESRIGSLTSTKEQLEETLQAKNDEIGDLSRQVTDLHSEREELRKAHATCDDRALEVTQLRTAVGSLQGSNGDLSQQLETAKRERARLVQAGQLVEQQNEILVAQVETLTSQGPNDLRRQVRSEVEREVRAEFQYGYSDLLARNTKRLQDQDRQIREKDAELEKAKSNPIVDHAACQQQIGNLQATITKLRQDAKIALGNYSRLSRDSKGDREELKHTQKANEDLKRELETIKADQRRAQTINPLQSKLAACQRESDKMKVDRDKARENCSIYSKMLSELKKQHQALQDGRNKEPIVPRHDQGTATSTVDESITRNLRNEVARLSKELEERKARDLARTARAHAGQSGTNPVRGERGGKKREYMEYSDEETDEEMGDKRKKAKLVNAEVEEERRRRLASGDDSTEAHIDSLQADKEME